MRYVLFIIVTFCCVQLNAQDTMWVDMNRYAELDFGKSQFYHRNGQLAIAYVKTSKGLKTREWNENGMLISRSRSKRRNISKLPVYFRLTYKYDAEGKRTEMMVTKMTGCNHIKRVRKKTY